MKLTECMLMEHFRHVLDLFYQIFSCHIFKHGKQFPVVYAFLPAKSRATYERMFTLIQDKADSTQLNLTVVADFELAIKQAIQLDFPTASFKGCYYHFCQALMRKIQEIGLQIQYQNNTDGLKSFVRKIAALSFVPVRFVRLAWQGIKAIIPQVPRIEDFISYFETYWLVGMFHLPEWNVYDTDGPRTNNHLEGWHNRLKRVVGKSHPNIYECVEVFQKEQGSTEISLIKLAPGARPPNRRKAIEKDKKIEEL